MSSSRAVPDGYNTPVPSKIMTPDRVETRIGTLEFIDGFPSDKTAVKVFDHLDFLRAVEVFLQCIPAASMEGLRAGLADIGCDAAHKVVIADRLLDSNSLFLTGNTDTVYAITMLDLDRDGPTVVQIPPGCGPGTVNDAWFRFVTDMGAPGPDGGAGGDYLLVPPGYDGEVPDGYHVARSSSYTNLLALRGFLVDGKTDAAKAMFENGVKIYPLSTAEARPQMEFSSISGKAFNTIHANDQSFYHEVADVIRREPIEVIDPETRGLLASIGIHKDRPFAPDERMRATLADAAAVGNASARAICFQTRDERAYYYEDRKWKTGFVGGDYLWLDGDGRGGRNLDARTMFFYQATLNTPAMALEMVGAGSQYALSERDASGAYLHGDTTYRLTLPPGIPAKDFWSLVVYDPQTRSELQTSQALPSRSSENNRDELTYNDDGSIDLTFGPEPPSTRDGNWIQTVPGKSWYAILRLYGPLEAWFDQTWIPDDIERL
ncbi:DUF1254 domain-containing protein [Streptomyces sp. SID13666]|uniref:DUF1254 domain-containing protein n=1 Tax=unclassified Streptomyces TaxID=2593676 RepID=UPI0013C1C03B|nr:MULTISPECIES: DUF1254 domain-containing protein [unclassified Streptomyces]MCZ4102589.1 DUF1254 domain-containing protein [Streptomyces sp. H39-C1]NEA59379.1 DUF1254 domain-containing protein [Streptomyces sp. SID13666]